MERDIIDVHLHFGAPYDSESGCYWSEEFEKGIAFFAMRLITHSLFGKIDIQRVKKHMLGVIKESKYVGKSVLLALDQVYDESGHVRRDKTNLHVPNSYLARLAKENDRVLFGASVHPYRSDWEDELNFCLANKAVLCKWLPSAQQINPSNPKCDRFFQKLAESCLPLLCHTGPEGSIPPFDGASQKLNKPKLLRKALDAGVAVIAAHCALPLLPPPLGNDSDFQELLALVNEAENRSWKLYADLSAICLGSRNFYIDKVKEQIPARRLVFGSDYPIPIMDFSEEPHLNPGHWMKHFLKTLFTKNPLDKNYFLIRNMEFDEAVFYNALHILKLS